MWKGLELPDRWLSPLSDTNTKKYIRFPDSQTFFCPSLDSFDGRVLALALEEEHTDFGRALVAALWFDRPVQMILKTGKEIMGMEACVYRCHIAGPLFTKKLLEIRSENPDHDMASAWELRFLKNIEVKDISEVKRPDRALEPEWHLDCMKYTKNG
ncbi:MAG: hypothetical protein HFJ10_09010 [Lachnospiraceae bacterium]|nr:hypothetical protein [Lachnospiraceae bacterium]